MECLCGTEAVTSGELVGQILSLYMKCIEVFKIQPNFCPYGLFCPNGLFVWGVSGYL